MALVDMKRPKPKKGNMKGMAMPVMAEESYYPWGLQIRLEKEELEKLGLKASSFDVGQTVNITASAKVTSISSREAVREKEGSQVVELQIEKIGLDKKSAKFAGWANEQKKGPTE